MKVKQGLYESLVLQDNETKPLWHIGNATSFFAGPLTYNALHSHSTSIFITGLYEPFLFRQQGFDWMVCDAVVVPAGVSYELDIRGNPLSVFYLEPSKAGVQALLPLLGAYDEIGKVLTSFKCDNTILRELYEKSDSSEWVDLALNDLVKFSHKKARSDIDPRILHVVKKLNDNPAQLLSLPDALRDVGLSCSRFQNIFKKEIGVSFCRYRGWHRLRAAIQEVIEGENFTIAAHKVGFFDQAHFNHHFKKTFGAAPGKSLSMVRSLQ
ncbi:AraC family transcriptional regulator [Hyphomicrobiales bacterium 4NK60-0047b]